MEAILQDLKCFTSPENVECLWDLGGAQFSSSKTSLRAKEVLKKPKAQKQPRYDNEALYDICRRSFDQGLQLEARSFA